MRDEQKSFFNEKKDSRPPLLIIFSDAVYLKQRFFGYVFKVFLIQTFFGATFLLALLVYFLPVETHRVERVMKDTQRHTCSRPHSFLLRPTIITPRYTVQSHIFTGIYVNDILWHGWDIFMRK